MGKRTRVKTGAGWRRIVAAAAVLAVIALAVAAGLVWRDRRWGRVVSLEDIDLADVYAVTRIAVDETWNRPREPQFIAFLHTDGSYELVRMEHMYLSAMVWDSDGLFFSDENHDYLMTVRDGATQVSVVDSPKRADTQLAAWHEGGDEPYAGMFSVGFTDDPASGEYQYQMLVSDGQSSRTVDFTNEFTYTSFAACGTTLYGLDSSAGADGEPRTAYLDRIASDGEPDKRRVAEGSGPLEDMFTTGQTLPCEDDVIYMIGTQYSDTQPTAGAGAAPSGEATAQTASTHPTATRTGLAADDGGTRTPLGTWREDSGGTATATGRTPAGLAMRHPRLLGWHYPSLESWNVRTGERTVIPLVDEDGSQLDWTEDVAAMDSDTAENLIRDGWMYWMSGMGDLTRTNLSTGVTQVLNDDLHDGSGAASLSSQFLPGKAVALKYAGNSRRTLELAEYSLPDGTATRRIPLDALAGRLRDLRPQGFAANPQYAGA